MKTKSATLFTLTTAIFCAVFNAQIPAQSASVLEGTPQATLQSKPLSSSLPLLAQAQESSLSAEVEQLVLEGLAAFQTETEEGYKLAIANWEMVEPEVLASERPDDIALLYLLLGRAYDLLGQNQTALKYYEQALPSFRSAGDLLGEARALNFIGLLQDGFGERQEAFRLYAEALALSEQVGDLEMQATVLGNIGSTHNALGDKLKAIEFYDQSVEIVRELGNKNMEGTLLNNIGFAYNDLGEKDEALEYYDQALPLLKEVGDRRMEATVLNNIGLVYDSLGDKPKALDFYDQALVIIRSIGDPTMEATVLNNVGLAYDALGEKQQALDAYQKSLPLSELGGARPMVGTTLNNIGLVYYSLGEYDQALEYYQQSLPISRAVGDRQMVATSLNNLGLTYQVLAQQRQHNELYLKAYEFYNESLSLSTEIGDRRMTATTLNNLGLISSLIDEPQDTLEIFNLALPIIRDVGDRRMEATTLGNIALVHSNLGEFEQALNFYNQALLLAQAVGDRSAEALNLVNLATLEYEQGQSEVALNTMEQAIAIVEDLRTKVVSPELRQSYFATVQTYYQFYIKLLMELDQENPGQGFAQRAFAASEKSRARTLLELLTEANADIRTGIDSDLLEQEKTLLAQLNSTEAERIEIYGTDQSTDIEKEQVDVTLSALVTEYEALQDKIRRLSPNYADLKYPQTLDVKTLQNQILDEDTILLQYALGAEKSYLWAVTKNEFMSYELPSTLELNPLINEARQQITDVREGLPSARQQQRQQDRQATLQELSQVILAPAAVQLQGKRVLVVADGNLHYLPFSILSSTSDYEPLSDRHEIINLPSASTLAILRQQAIAPIKQDSSFAIFADPVFNQADCRLQGQGANCATPIQPQQNLELEIPENDLALLALKRSANNFEQVNWDRLPGTRTEAQGILELLPNNTETLKAFDFEANRDILMGDRLQNYELIHIATHGFLNASEPELSGLVLSLFDENQQLQNGFLRLNDVFNLKLNANLLVLSACETGLGENVQGEGLVGLSRGFMYAGVPRIVMSLWQVSDEATAEFMTRFYRNLLEEKLTAAAALKETQREMREETQWTHPYYWSAFILQGEWN
ncbi:Tetratricopeptide TPR_1 repeat-containing protein [[Leptolyngbya] sp. PCC 7376]|uniref:CHAT domain-containing tetratricopeptide repeat protein n=1 Tax=[Leptolyngbya] sp. PCC 7376 TaxID=111781 RepID=UPI00029F0554|nr:tetratricopeptide repeat protein [[Leptolyngbya] sp. PCC 7376]AFY37701.1 Tetratricopeptide TPR_1 repeat-containing protein [[Leptolyngbya] sp. PCC 7376]